ncbi:YpdA family putative bacillithiol disulfide reductase [Pedobacter sp. SYSU D00535]|uniref:YpdA family putative bacillithiol disulfide reductase n=1 Tax=Pedobacter sp. SYSU D00535 TaxID=2810308 RepID=UPI001A95C06D|nr:YpdA family putative bacillithiol disulfide reductase [Pedobacter sp. SYSU D00535]
MEIKEDHSVDVLIIGAGPIGLACGIEALKAGLSYVIIEKGCLVNSLYHYPVNMTFFSTSERLEIGNIPFVSINPKPTRAEALEYYRRVAVHYNLNIRLFESVTTVKETGENFAVETTKSSYKATNIIVATGFYDIPATMDIPGEHLSKVRHYYQDPHFYAFQKVAVVGANNSSVDVALETFRKGAEVTMIIRGNSIGNRVKYWVKPDIENRIKEGSIQAFFCSELTEVREDEIDIQTPEGKVTLKNDFVLAMTGYQPNFNFLRTLGITLSEDEILSPTYNPQTMETNIKGLYLAGVVCGGMNTHSLFIENSREHAEKIIWHLTEKNKRS